MHVVSRRTLMFGFGAAGMGVLPKFSFADPLPPAPDPSVAVGESLPVGAPSGPIQAVPDFAPERPWSIAMIAPNVRGVSNIIYRVGDTYSPIALHKLSIMMRDCHEQVWHDMDPRLFDLLSWIQAASGSEEPITLTSGYRTPRTELQIFPNNPIMAQTSPHIRGMAADIRIHGIDPAWIRDAGLHLGLGGVGWYPRQQFVHIDTGPPRHWTA